MAEQTAKILVTVVCYDCAPEAVATRMAAKMPDDLAWYTIGPDGEFEIIDAKLEEQIGGSGASAAHESGKALPPHRGKGL